MKKRKKKKKKLPLLGIFGYFQDSNLCMIASTDRGSVSLISSILSSCWLRVQAVSYKSSWWNMCKNESVLIFWLGARSSFLSKQKVSASRKFVNTFSKSIQSLINECPCFYLDQVDLLQNQPIVNTTDWNPKTLLKFAKIDTIKNALSYNDHTEYIW